MNNFNFENLETECRNENTPVDVAITHMLTAFLNNDISINELIFLKNAIASRFNLDNDIYFFNMVFKKEVKDYIEGIAHAYEYSDKPIKFKQDAYAHIFKHFKELKENNLIENPDIIDNYLKSLLNSIYGCLGKEQSTSYTDVVNKYVELAHAFNSFKIKTGLENPEEIEGLLSNIREDVKNRLGVIYIDTDMLN